MIQFLAALVLGTAASAQPQAGAASLVACGDDQVRVIELREGEWRETWRWSASEADDLPEQYRNRWLRTIDECKPVDGGAAILATSSSGGVVLIERASGRATFRAHAPNAHSADVLPGGRIAVALSTNEQGNRLEVYDRTRIERPLFHVSLPSGHGAVWDAERQRLYALSFDHLQSFSLKDWQTGSPRLEEEDRWRLPGVRNGHDLSLDPVRGDYVLTTADGAWRFTPETGEFSPLPPINPARRIKAVSFSRDRMAWVAAEQSWWAFGFTVAARDGSSPERVPTPGLHLYKVRWLDAR